MYFFLFLSSKVRNYPVVISMHMIINYYFMNQNHLLNLIFFISSMVKLPMKWPIPWNEG